jgi:hypothetical protein
MGRRASHGVGISSAGNQYTKRQIVFSVTVGHAIPFLCQTEAAFGGLN